MADNRYLDYQKQQRNRWPACFDDSRHAYVLTTWWTCSSCPRGRETTAGSAQRLRTQVRPEAIKLCIGVFGCAEGEHRTQSPSSPKLLILSLSFSLWRWTIGPPQAACRRAVARFVCAILRNITAYQTLTQVWAPVREMSHSGACTLRLPPLSELVSRPCSSCMRCVGHFLATADGQASQERPKPWITRPLVDGARRSASSKPPSQESRGTYVTRTAEMTTS